MASLLIIEDERPMRVALADLLRAHGHQTTLAADGAEGLRIASEQPHDLILLDVMMPKIDGITLCAALRRSGCTAPVLMLTAKGQVADRVAGLDAGADDYLTKPFSSAELLARVRALLRRAGGLALPELLTLGTVRIDLKKHTALRDGQPVELSRKEVEILRLLATQPGQPITRDQFLDTVWGYNAYPTTRTVDNFIANLRAKIEADPAHPLYIRTVHGVGYKLVLDPDEAKMTKP